MGPHVSGTSPVWDQPGSLAGEDKGNLSLSVLLGSEMQGLEVGRSKVSLLLLPTPNAAHLPCNTHAGLHPTQSVLKKPLQINQPPNRSRHILPFLLITDESPINLIKTLQSPFSSGEFSSLFPQKSLWMYCQEHAFAVAFQVA